MARYLALLLTLAASLLVLSVHGSAAPPGQPHGERGKSPCRCFPGDSCWPTSAEWEAFNRTVGGKLLATVPIGAPCHTSDFPPYDSQKCDALKNVWFFPETHLESPSSVMAPFFTNNSCNPFLSASTSCTLGNYISYAVKATNASDFQKTMSFAQKRNIRLIIRNTGHDYLGKSTGAGALSIWTHHMKSMELKDYASSSYSGKAMKMSAGVEIYEAYKFADSNGLVIVGGNCPTVGLVGGYTQGGGHGPLASTFGLAADQVLEWEVVTSTGQLLTATPNQNQDLYWALCGGGGGTFGAVVSLTAKAYPSTIVSAANMTFLNTGSNADHFYDVVATFIKSLPALVDAGAVVIWLITPQAFLVMPATAPGMSKADLDELLEPTLARLNKHGIPHTYFSQEFPTFLQSYNAMTSRWNVSDYQLGGRLIPRSLVMKNNDALVAAIRSIVDAGTIISGVSVNVARGVAAPDAVAVNPYWRRTIFMAVLGTPYSFNDWEANLRYQQKMTNELLPQLGRLTPNGGAYLSEADFLQPGWKSLFYGRNYDELNKIKARYDPEDRLYAVTAVGSDRWIQQQDGRLCKV
jgi:FAD binding domain/Berberine and berberine like